MPRLHILIIYICIVVLMISGCTKQHMHIQQTPSVQHPALLTFLTNHASDIPLPLEYTSRSYQVKDSFISFVYTTQLGMQELVDYLIDACAQEGWYKHAQFTGSYTTLLFLKPIRTLIITIEDQNVDRLVTVQSGTHYKKISI